MIQKAPVAPGIPANVLRNQAVVPSKKATFPIGAVSDHDFGVPLADRLKRNDPAS
jgi:hypothetical protein